MIASHSANFFYPPATDWLEVDSKFSQYLQIFSSPPKKMKKRRMHFSLANCITGLHTIANILAKHPLISIDGPPPLRWKCMKLFSKFFAQISETQIGHMPSAKSNTHNLIWSSCDDNHLGRRVGGACRWCAGFCTSATLCPSCPCCVNMIMMGGSQK